MTEIRKPFVLLMQLSVEGALGVESMPDRYDELKDKARELGGKLTACYVTMGIYDVVATVLLPDNEAAMFLALWLTEQGYFRTTTLPASDMSKWEFGGGKK